MVQVNYAIPRFREVYNKAFINFMTMPKQTNVQPKQQHFTHTQPQKSTEYSSEFVYQHAGVFVV